MTSFPARMSRPGSGHRPDRAGHGSRTIDVHGVQIVAADSNGARGELTTIRSRSLAKQLLDAAGKVSPSLRSTGGVPGRGLFPVGAAAEVDVWRLPPSVLLHPGFRCDVSSQASS